MNGTVWQRLDHVARLIAPALMTIMLVVLAQVPVPLPDYAVVSPGLALMSVYYWAVSRPELLPAPVVFAVGLFQDMLSGVPAGMNALLLLLAYGITVSQRRVFSGRSFSVVWSGFLLAAAAVGAAQWLLMSILAGSLLAPQPVLMQFMLTVALYPVLAWVLVQIHRALARGEAP